MNQAGSGIAGFQGIRYQKGNGFMGRVISGAIMPILRKVLPYLGKTALSAGANIMQDYEEGTPLTESATRRLKETKAEITRKTKQKFKELTGGRRPINKRHTAQRTIRCAARTRARKRTLSTTRKTPVKRRKVEDFLL